MTEHEDIPVAGSRALDEATDALRRAPTELTGVAAARIRDLARSTPRPALLLRAAPPREYLSVSTTALTSLLRQRIDQDLSHGAVGHVAFAASRDGRLEQVRIDLLVQYGHDARELAARTHAVAAAVVEELLGSAPPPAGVDVRHVHVADVTLGDPHLVDPRDED